MFFMIYEVNEGDTFDFRFYPEVQSELVAIARHLKQIPGDHKAEIVISYLKDHCIKTDWFKENEDVIRLITSRFLTTSHIEALFNGGRKNRVFVIDFERFILSSLA